MAYIRSKYPRLLPVYTDIYAKGNNAYWQSLDNALQSFAIEQGLEYKTNDDTFTRPFTAPPVMVNYFYHSKIKKSAQKRFTN